MNTKLPEVRLTNMRTLIANFETKREFADRCGLAPAQVNQLAGENPTTNIGDILARRIEEGCGRPEFWLDIDHDEELGKQESRSIEIHIEATLMLNKVLVEQKFVIEKIDPVVYGGLLRHIITMAMSIGRVTKPQVQSTLSLANINKAARKR